MIPFTQHISPFASSYDSAWVCCDTLLLGFAPYQTLALGRVPDSDSRMLSMIGLTIILCDSQESEYSVKRDLETICVHTNVAQISIVFQPLAAAEGYVPDSYVTSDLVTTGRPAPSMIYLNMVGIV